MDYVEDEGDVDNVQGKESLGEIEGEILIDRVRLRAWKSTNLHETDVNTLEK